MKGWEVITKIKTMTEDGSSVSSIARKLRIDRKTVRKYRDMSHDDIAGYKTQRQTRKKKSDGEYKLKQILTFLVIG